ncbi:siderophore-interacting protein [Ruania alba]|uniref:NADPH-dependent ferric siderophore reductase, contains FAD-binding and SIP domains n=1 Tax=Ruania alba TaxID=648782 RepID=A0A1H5G5S5_9MICO|nr:siderophore-interacting protein [Ruania alba]SEE11017.1 NADPH-dependent ferric siderophore reductase, contains FAD-binding and SIP domains [Ruania alba]
MLTSPSLRDAVVKDDRPAYRPFSARVQGMERLGPHIVRVTFTGPQLHWFGTDGDDQRIKIVLPEESTGQVSDIGADDEETCLAGTWYEQWRALPEASRSPIRTYTVRAVRPQAAEIDVDMVAHGDAGPASRWLARARVGDWLVIAGPDERSSASAGGRDWHPGTAETVLLAGDETAAPAICAILEGLRPECRARAFIEIPEAADAIDVDLPAGAEITWLSRDDAAHGDLLLPAVVDWAREHTALIGAGRASSPELEDVDVDTQLLWDSPVLRAAPDTCGRGERCGGDFYAWFAGEASVIKTLRRVLVSELGVCRRRVAFMGYWRAGRAEPT